MMGVWWGRLVGGWYRIGVFGWGNRFVGGSLKREREKWEGRGGEGFIFI